MHSVVDRPMAVQHTAVYYISVVTDGFRPRWSYWGPQNPALAGPLGLAPAHPWAVVVRCRSWLWLSESVFSLLPCPFLSADLQ
jgi:hypothetical protein